MPHSLSSRRGTVGVGEIIEALSDPARAKTFASRIGELIKDAKVNERVRDSDWHLMYQIIVLGDVVLVHSKSCVYVKGGLEGCLNEHAPTGVQSGVNPLPSTVCSVRKG